jgi:hypothetical protein
MSKYNVETALAALRKAKHAVGVASVRDGVVYILIDDVPRTIAEIFLMAESVHKTTGPSGPRPKG